MRRWNGWGDSTVSYLPAPGAVNFIAGKIGAANPPRDIHYPDAVKLVSSSRVLSNQLISTDAPERLCHARGQSLPDWIAMRSGQINIFPDGVAYPSTDEDIRQLLDWADKTKARLIPYGGGTSVAGHINPLAGERPVITVDMRRMNGLKHFDETSNLATFGAGIAGPDLEAHLRARDCTLGHFPQSFELSTLGGWIVTRSCGQQSLGYGRIERLFAGGKLESPAGSVVLPAFPASAAGPDLREVIMGSEGRLGILTEATVRASLLPEKEEFFAVFLRDFETGCQAAREMIQARLPLSLLRLSCANETETTLALAGHKKLIEILEKYFSLRGLSCEKCMLLIGVSGYEGVVRAARREALEIADNYKAVYVGKTFGSEWHRNRFRAPYLRNAFWEMGYAIDTLETAADWEKLPDLLADMEAALNHGLDDVGEKVHIFTHLSQLYAYGSSIYTTYVIRLHENPAENLRRWRVLKTAASEVITSHQATISHQHGIGTDHLPYLAQEKGKLGMKVIADICRRLDPQQIMNPGKLISVSGCAD